MVSISYINRLSKKKVIPSFFYAKKYQKEDLRIVTETIKTTMKEFAEAVRDAVEASLGEEYQVQIHDVVRNNDTHLTGLVIYNGISNMTPNIYLEYYFNQYQSGMTMDEISQDIIRTYEKHRVSEMIIPGFSEPPVRTLRATIPENESHIFW